MGFRDELNMESLTQEQKDFVNMVDKKLTEGLEDVENGRIYDISEIKEFLNNKDSKIIYNQKTTGVLV